MISDRMTWVRVNHRKNLLAVASMRMDRGWRAATAGVAMSILLCGVSLAP
jgi:hypothetical protein